jgi:hypothetical protein
MRFRKLRIAWSVGWGMVAVLVIVFWWRSYSMLDAVWLPPTRQRAISLESLLGRVWLRNYGTYPPWVVSPFHVRHLPMMNGWKAQTAGGFLGFTYYQESIKGGRSTVISVPHWFALLSCIPVGAVSWAHWSNRFSLRALLIATTLVAVVLGLIMWMSQTG